ncbi:MAG: hypothetical protein QOJ35_1385 [Solirubrobacteraceae bacterium]|jgi:hypothetical protein|nr:hypothetical protein [Solirubrobacteraceae bacterium]
MTHSTATRRLVKSAPELWAELSSEESLGRHLAPFGEIRITRVEPETTVAWEGDRASGTVELAPTGWGTKVILTARPSVPPDRPLAVAEEVQVAAPPAPAPAEAPPAPRRGFFARLFRRRSPAGNPPPAVEARKSGAERTMSASRSPDGSNGAPSAGIPGPPVPAPDPVPPTPAPDPSPLPPAPDPVPPTPTPAPPVPQIEVLDPCRTAAILGEVLDDLGAAHHRPFSRD